jgi:hypothetical protein
VLTSIVAWLVRSFEYLFSTNRTYVVKTVSLLTLLLSSTLAACDIGPELKVQTFRNNFIDGVTITNVGDDPITITGATINGNEDCVNGIALLGYADKPRGWAKAQGLVKFGTLQVGQDLNLINYCPGQIVRVDVETNHGTGNYRFQ